MIKAVIFDVDGVLLDSFEANLKFYQDLLAHSGHVPPSRKDYSELFHLSSRDLIRALAQSSSEDEIDRIVEREKTAVADYPIELLKIPENAEETIKTLSKDYVLGIATSRIREGIFTSLKLAKLEKYFQVVIGYQDTAEHKPHPEPLLLAAQKLGVQTQEAVYVGDSESDITAAKAAGMKIILYSEDHIDGADAYTSSFEKLPDLIKSL